MKSDTVHLGYAIPTGEPVEVPIAHMIVTGQTQASGKTSTLEALISRSGRKAIAFVTKRGEGAFSFNTGLYVPVLNAQNEYDVKAKANIIKPFFRQRADWQFVSDILGAILSEKLKFQRPWIMKVCKGAKTLDDVRANVVNYLYGVPSRKIRPATGLPQSVYTELEEYFELLIPEIARLPYTDKLELSDGLNVMDLSDYSTALQMLVIAAVLDEIYKKYKGVIVVIPEAWEFVPNGKNSPVKSAANTLARKGAALKNFIWLDSQDMASIDTEVRRACSVFILGVQREQNEVKRLLAHIPNMPKPKVEDVMHLEIGQFFACFGRELHKVYVQPAWMEEATAQMVARGELVGYGELDAPPRAEDVAVGDPIVFIDSRGEPPRYAEEVSHVKTKPHTRLSDTPVAEWESLVFDPKHARSSDVETGTYSRTPPGLASDIETGTYSRTPPGLAFKIDDGADSHNHDRINEAVAKEIDVDSAERQRYEAQLLELKRMIYNLERALPSRNFAKDHGFEEWLATNGGNPNADDCIDFTREEASRGPCAVPQSPGTSGKELYETVDLVSRILNSKPTLEQFAKALIPYLPAASTVTLEPAEYVLKKFQQEEVARILVATDDRSVFQKRAIKFAEAKGKGTRTADLITTITGKRSKNMARDCKDEYEELGELAALGFLRYDRNNGVYHPNTGVMIKSRLSQFDPSTEDVDEIVGQIILKLK